MKTLSLALAALALSGGAALADGWALNPALSSVAFGSVKNDSVGESHRFGAVSGTVSAAGAVTLSIDLASVDTGIEIRDSRMIEHVFRNAATATVSAQVDAAALSALGVGEATALEASGTLSLLGVETELDAPLWVLRLSADRVLVATDGMLFLSAEDAGIEAGIAALQEIAGLDSISRVSPVTLRLVFDAQ